MTRVVALSIKVSLSCSRGKRTHRENHTLAIAGTIFGRRPRLPGEIYESDKLQAPQTSCGILCTLFRCFQVDSVEAKESFEHSVCLEKSH